MNIILKMRDISVTLYSLTLCLQFKHLRLKAVRTRLLVLSSRNNPEFAKRLRWCFVGSRPIQASSVMKSQTLQRNLPRTSIFYILKCLTLIFNLLWTILSIMSGKRLGTSHWTWTTSLLSVKPVLEEWLL